MMLGKLRVSWVLQSEQGTIVANHLCNVLDVAATSRASFYIYNTKKDVDALIDSLNIVAKVFKL